MKIEILKFSNPLFEQVKNIRETVFEKEQGAVASEEIDLYDSDEATDYALAYDGDMPVATGRIAKTPNGIKIGRIAVLKSQRGRGTGKALVEFLCDRAYEMGADIVYVDAQLHAVPFYERLGFVPTGEAEIVDRGIKHLPMRKLYEK